jgi:hypothetical protein
VIKGAKALREGRNGMKGEGRKEIIPRLISMGLLHQCLYITMYEFHLL